MAARATAILEELRRQPRIGIQELAARFGVSEMSIRRDAVALENQGLVLRTYGGGVVLSPMPGAALQATLVPVSWQKVAVGRLAASLVAPGQTIMVDTGTTALQVARHLPLDADLTVATTSLPIAQELSHTPFNVLLLGGFVQKDTQAVFGPLTEQMLAILHVDLLFIGCNGADTSTGFYADNLLLYTQVRAMMRSAAQTVVAAESSKFSHRSFVRYAGLEGIQCLVTDAGLSDTDRQNLEEAGVRVLIPEEKDMA